MRHIIIAAVFFATFSYAETAFTYPKGLFKVTQGRVDVDRRPHGLDWYLKSRESQVILSSISTYMGVDPTYVVLALEAIPNAEVKGEETFYSFPTPQNYTYCAARIDVESLNPGSGKRASVLNANVSPTGVGVYTWTPVGAFGGPGSWAKANVQVLGILPTYYDEFIKKGVCQAINGDAEKLIDCVGHNCSGGSHGVMQDVGSSTIDLKSGY